MKNILFILCLISTTAFADNYALIDQSGTVANVMEYDGKSPYTPPAGDTLVKDPNDPPQVAKGWTYVDGDFSPPVQPDPPSQ